MHNSLLSKKVHSSAGLGICHRSSTTPNMVELKNKNEKTLCGKNIYIIGNLQKKKKKNKVLLRIIV